MWVCPHTTVRTGCATPESTSLHRSGSLSTRTNSSSSRGVAWQNNASPMVTVVGKDASNVKLLMAIMAIPKVHAIEFPAQGTTGTIMAELMGYLDKPPHPAEVDPMKIPPEHRETLVKLIWQLVGSDANMHPDELQAVRDLEELLLGR